MIFRVLPLVAGLGLAGCASNLNASYVAPMAAPGDASVLATGIVDFLAARMVPATTTLTLDPLSSDSASDTVTPILTTTLRKRGFAIVDATVQPATTGARRMRYWISPMYTGDLVRLAVDGDAIEGSQFFIRNTAGGLQAGGPVTVRTAETAS